MVKLYSNCFRFIFLISIPRLAGLRGQVEKFDLHRRLKYSQCNNYSIMYENSGWIKFRRFRIFGKCLILPAERNEVEIEINYSSEMSVASRFCETLHIIFEGCKECTDLTPYDRRNERNIDTALSRKRPNRKVQAARPWFSSFHEF